MPASPPLIEIASTLMRDIGALLARWLTAWSLVIFHAWGEGWAGYHHYFGPKDRWPLSEAISAAGVPAGLAVATALTVALALIALAFAFGLLTRVAAFVLLVVAAAVASVASADSLQESAAAYAAVACLLLFGGPGHFSLDALVVFWRDQTQVGPKHKKAGPKYR